MFRKIRKAKALVKIYYEAFLIGCLTLWFAHNVTDANFYFFGPGAWNVWATVFAILLILYPFIPYKFWLRNIIAFGVTSSFAYRLLNLTIMQDVGFLDPRVPGNLLIVILLLMNWPYILPSRTAEELKVELDGTR